MSIYRGVGGVNREIKNIYRGVGGVNREIKEQYRGVSGVNRAVYRAEWDNFKYTLSKDLTNTAKITGDKITLEYDYSDYGVPYIHLYSPVDITISSLRIKNLNAWNYQSNPNTSKCMDLRIKTNGGSAETQDKFNYAASNVVVHRDIECANNVGSIVGMTAVNCITIMLYADEHRPNVNVVCAVLEIPNKSIILNGRPIDFTKMTVK